MKYFFSIIILTFLLRHGYSQNINFGIGAGLNYSSFQSDKQKIDFNYKIGFQINAIVEYKFNVKIGIRVEPGFTNRGFVISNNLPPHTDSKMNINYLYAPILFSYSPFEKFSILIGPEIAFKLSAKSTLDGKTSDYTTLYNSKYDIGVNIGLSYRIIKNMNIGLRYNRGFISTIKDLKFMNDGGVMEEVKIYNQGLSILLTYMIK